MGRERYVVFCATQRTGSTLIYDDIRNLMGYPITDSERLYIEVIRGRSTKPWVEIIEGLRADNSVHDLVMAKVMFHYTPYLSAAIAGLAIGETPPIYRFESAEFDPFYNFFRDAIWVYIGRNDVYSQAVSMYFAETTDVWHRWEISAETDSAFTPRGAYDRARMLRYLENLMTERDCWQLFFNCYGITPIRLSYEDAISGYPAYLDEFLSVAGLSPQSPPPSRRMAKVGDAMNAEFARLLREDARVALCERQPADS